MTHTNDRLKTTEARLARIHTRKTSAKCLHSFGKREGRAPANFVLMQQHIDIYRPPTQSAPLFLFHLFYLIFFKCYTFATNITPPFLVHLSSHIPRTHTVLQLSTFESESAPTLPLVVDDVAVNHAATTHPDAESISLLNAPTHKRRQFAPPALTSKGCSCCCCCCCLRCLSAYDHSNEAHDVSDSESSSYEIDENAYFDTSENIEITST